LKNRTQLPLVMLIKDSVSDDRLADWSRSFYGVGVWVNVVAPHHTAENGYKNWIGNNATDFVAQAHAHGLKVNPCMLRAGRASAGFFFVSTPLPKYATGSPNAAAAAKKFSPRRRESTAADEFNPRLIILDSFISEREYAVARLSVVCLSVTLVHPTQAVEILGNFSTAFGTLATL